MVDHPLKKAYETTDYRVGDVFTIRCGETTPPLDDLLSAGGHDSWAFLTAWNPGSIRHDDADNRRRMIDLSARIALLGLATLEGEGVGTEGEWPPEPSLLVLGLGVPEALALGREYGQVAIVVGRRGEPARLVFCTPEATGAPGET